MLPNGLNLEKFLILVGEGANGKSTILHVLEAMVGSNNCSHVSLSSLQNDFSLEAMRGKLCNISGDMQRLERAEEGILKQLVSGDVVTVNRKHKSHITMKPTARLVFACNTLPGISDRSDGLWRRAIFMPCLQRFSEQDADLVRVPRLRTELAGIFNWAIEGVRRLYHNGYFTTCRVCAAAVATHRIESDVFLQFAGERLETAPDWQVSCQALYDEFKRYCEQNGCIPTNSSNFGRRILRLPGVSRHRDSSGQRGYSYRGVRAVGTSEVVNERVADRQPCHRGLVRS